MLVIHLLKRTILNCENRIFTVSSFHKLTLRQNLLGKLSDIAFVNLLCPIILKHLKKILRSDHGIQDCIILDEI